MLEDSEEMIHFVAQTIYDKKGSNIVCLDIRGISNMTDYILIAEGNVDRHVKAIASEIEAELKKRGRSAVHIEGRQSGDWMVLDYSDIVIHLFMPGMREKYKLEKLWSEGKIVDLKIEVQAGKFK